MLTHNAKEIFRHMQQRRDRVTAELTEAARKLGPALSGAAKEELQEQIYNVPIPLKASADHGLSLVPEHLRAAVLRREGAREKGLSLQSGVRGRTTKGKFGQWVRTGNLKRQESFRIEGPVIALLNYADYARARNALGTSEGRPIKSAGVRSVQWQEEAIRKHRDLVLRERREAVLKALQG